MMYKKSDLKKAFNAGKACMKMHPDDDTYDKVHFDSIVKKIEVKKASQENMPCHLHQKGWQSLPCSGKGCNVRECPRFSL